MWSSSNPYRSVPPAGAPAAQLSGSLAAQVTAPGADLEINRRIGAAVGMLMVVHDLTYSAATDLLHDLSREHGRSPFHVALHITDRTTDHATDRRGHPTIQGTA